MIFAVCAALYPSEYGEVKMEEVGIAITPGTPVIEVISARRGTIGEDIISQIAFPSRESEKYPRRFGEWDPKTWVGKILVPACGNEFQLRLTLLEADEEPQEGLFLKEVTGQALSLKPVWRSGIPTLFVGSHISTKRILSFANAVVTTFVIHGRGWKNRSGEEFVAPYGRISTYPRSRHSRRRLRQREKALAAIC